MAAVALFIKIKFDKIDDRFGKTEIIIPDRVIVIEIKTLNSKQLDLNCRLASLFREKENEIDNFSRKN